MGAWHALAQEALYGFNLLTIAYFFLGNGVYTVLMAFSLGAAMAYKRRRSYEGLREIRESAATPPLTVIIPCRNEEASILDTVRSVLRSDYPDLRVVVVDDGSTDGTASILIEQFHLSSVRRIARSPLRSCPVLAYYHSAQFPGLTLVRKSHGGKADALNAGVNFCRTPYFCTLDADCLVEPDALLRLMAPILRSPAEILVSSGTIRVRNGCKVANGRVEQVRLPQTRIERLQVVEYLRWFLLGRSGWDLVGGTLLVSGAMAVFQRKSVVAAGGFSTRTVGEDMELIIRLHHVAGRRHERARLTFTMGTVAWAQCPNTVRMLGRQRRRWQLGLCQAVAAHWKMAFRPRYSIAGLFSLPFYIFVETAGAAVELIGYVIVPIALATHLALISFYIPLVILSLAYGSFLSAGAVLIEEMTDRTYPSAGDLWALVKWSVLENFGFRQLVLYFRVQGLLRFLAGAQQWETVSHPADEPASGGS